MKHFLPYISTYLDSILAGMGLFLPELALILLFIAVMLFDLFLPKRNQGFVFWLSLAGMAGVFLLSFRQLGLVNEPVPLFNDMLILDRISILFKLIFGITSLLFILFIRNNKALQEHKKGTGDLFMILTAVHLGLHLMAMAANLITIFIAIEMVSIGSYLMTGYLSGNRQQSEAAMKYVLFGLTCSAVMLYGMSLLYAFTGTLEIYRPEFLTYLKDIPSLSASIAIILVLVGIGFKLSFVPFQFWSPDVYEGAPTPVTAFLSTGPKIAGFAILIHFLAAFRDAGLSSSVDSVLNFEAVLALTAFITMVIGNFSALWQDNVKRMLAYSSIGHTGFLLMAVIAFSTAGFNAIIFYLFIYALMNMAAFMLADRIEEQAGVINSSDYKGLGRKMKIELFCFVIVLVSLTGLPPTAGFIGKFLVFSAGIENYVLSGSVWMLVLLAAGAVTTVVSLFYYFKIPLNAYLKRPSEDFSAIIQAQPWTYFILLLTVLLLVFGIWPGGMTSFIGGMLKG